MIGERRCVHGARLHRHRLLLGALCWSIVVCSVAPDTRAGTANAAARDLEAGFEAPPISARPLGWWHWINGNVTKAGIAADLESAKDVGMGGVQLFDVEMYLPPGPVRYGSDDWFEHVRFAMEKAAELGLEFHVMNTPGWSASGGPWVTPERSMKRVVWSETPATSGTISLQLATPETKPIYATRRVKMEPFYRDIAVLAVPVTSERISDIDKKIGWGERPVVRDVTPERAGIPREHVLDLSAKMDGTGRLEATLPPGEWTILRFGYVSTGKTNHPAVKEGHGLEIDKLDAQAVEFQFEQSLGRILKQAGPLAGRTFTAVLFDSFEGGFQNWTGEFPSAFRTQKGYDLIPWLPVLTGRVVGSTAQTEAVLWDFRNVIEEMIAENYYGTMHRLAAKHRLKIYSESQGGPITPMSANRHVDVPMNEFWTPDAAPRASRIKMSTSAASLAGRTVVAAEAFTSTPENGKFQNTPETLKRSGDYAFTLGLNRFALHSFTHQPVTEHAPGFALGRYGTHFGRLNTWWSYAREWMSYLSHSQFLLQQGRTVADVCLLVDEDMGYHLPPEVAHALPGYDFEIAYPDQLRAMTVCDGIIEHSSGARYRLLVTPEKTTASGWVATIEALRELRRLVHAGAHLSGPAPVAPAGLADWERREEFQDLVGEIWGETPRMPGTVTNLGRGRIYTGMSPLEILRSRAIAPDVGWEGAEDAIKFIHRTTPEGEIYFVFNNTAEARTAHLDFRQSRRAPEIWDAVNGTRAEAPMFTTTPTGVRVPLQFEPWGSAFVLFRRPIPERWITSAEPTRDEFKSGRLLTRATTVSVDYSDGARVERSLPPVNAQQRIDGPWQVHFVMGGREHEPVTFDRLVSWSEQTDPEIRFHSGTAIYRTTFEVAQIPQGQVAVLDLGRVADIARVVINGRNVGLLWKTPFRRDITTFLKPGKNALEIHVANRWINRLIGDEAIATELEYQPVGASKFTDGRLLALPEWLYDDSKRASKTRRTFTTWRHYHADSPLVPAGLLGPVVVEWWHDLASHPELSTGTPFTSRTHSRPN